MAYSPIVYPPQFHVSGSPASGYYLKAYKAGTTTAIQLATDRTGGTLVNKIQLNAEGRPEVSGNTVIPHLDQENKLALYPDETSADNDDTNSAIWIPDKIDVGSLPASYVDSIDTLSDLRNYSGEARTILLEGSSSSGDGDGALYYYSSGQSAGTYTDNGDTVIVPTGGDGSAAYLLIQFSHPNDLEHPVSTTSSGGTAGIDYDVSDWPDTLVSGRTYYFRAHADCRGGSNVEIEGISAKNESNQDLPIEHFTAGAIIAAYYNGAALMLSVPNKSIYHGFLNIVGGDDWARFARIQLNGSNNGTIVFEFSTARRFTNKKTAYISIDSITISNTIIETIIVDSDNLYRHDGIAVYSPSDGVVDIYVALKSATSGLQVRIVECITSDKGGQQWNVEVFDDETPDTESNITGGTFDVTSQAAPGEVIEDKSVSLGGSFSDSVRLIVTKTTSGKNVMISATGSFSHTSSSTPSSSSGVIESAYRPADNVSKVYEIDPDTGPNAVYRVEVQFDGDISFRYLDWTGSPSSQTSTANGWTLSYWVSD